MMMNQWFKSMKIIISYIGSIMENLSLREKNGQSEWKSSQMTLGKLASMRPHHSNSSAFLTST